MEPWAPSNQKRLPGEVELYEAESVVGAFLDADEGHWVDVASLIGILHDSAELQLLFGQGDVETEEALELEAEAVVQPHLQPTEFQPSPFRVGDGLI